MMAVVVRHLAKLGNLIATRHLAWGWEHYADLSLILAYQFHSAAGM